MFVDLVKSASYETRAQPCNPLADGPNIVEMQVEISRTDINRLPRKPIDHLSRQRIVMTCPCDLCGTAS